MKPTVGRIVHYHNVRHSAVGPFAAIVIAVTGNTVTLHVFFPAPGSPHEVVDVPHDDSAKDGEYWVWPPRD